MLPVSRGLARARVGAASVRPAATSVIHPLACASPRFFSAQVPKESLPYGNPWNTQRPRRCHERRCLGMRSYSSSGQYEVPEGTPTLETRLPNGRTLSIARFNNGLGFSSSFHRNGHVFSVELLRDSCSCTACRDVSSGQKSYATTQIVPDMKITDVRVTEEKGLVVSVDRDMETHGGSAGHDIQLSPLWVASRGDTNRLPLSQHRLLHRFKKVMWDSYEIETMVRKIDYEKFMQEDSIAFWDVIQDIARLGIVFLRNVPREEDAVTRIATRIANIRETFYGRTFDVRAKPNAENVAYTSGYLGLHQDLMYLNPPPYVQILHCMDNSCAGGESLFSDADRVGNMLSMLREYDIVELLGNVRAPYGYSRDGRRYRQIRHLLNYNGADYSHVYWSPPFQAEWDHPAGGMEGWIAAARIFEEAVNSPDALYQTRLEPGECVLFDNLRVLHGRTAFDAAGGSRWLRGAYIALEDFLSTAMNAPESHAAPMDNLSRWWRQSEAKKQLRTTPAFRKLESKIDHAQSSMYKNRA